MHRLSSTRPRVHFPGCRLVMLWLLLGASLSPLLAVTITNAPSDEEFAGPFASWRNVQTYYGAKGDGVSDDTPVVGPNRAQRSARGPQQRVERVVLPCRHLLRDGINLLPAGSNHDYTGCVIVGADLSTTTLKYTGSSGGTLLTYDGLYCAIRRLHSMAIAGWPGCGLCQHGTSSPRSSSATSGSRTCPSA